MNDSDLISPDEQTDSTKNVGPLIMFIAAVVLVVIALWQFSKDQTADKITADSTPEIHQKPPEVIEAEIAEEPIDAIAPTIIEQIEIEQVEIKLEQESTIEEIVLTAPSQPLPSLDESDSLIAKKLPELTWRTELLSLIINDDMVRRFVVFTDNFAQGLLAYEHTIFIQPKVKFNVDQATLNVTDSGNKWQWNEQNSKRFDLYVDLLRSIDSTTLVNQYFELKPLIDEAYEELGYEEDFAYTLQDAIVRVLDMELPRSPMALTQTSVMYKFEDKELESLDDSDKLLLRIGKENLLIIKSVLLEVNEKLTKKLNEKR